MRGTLRTKDLWHWQLSAEAEERLLIRCRPLISKQPSVSFPGPLSRRLTACFRFNSCQQDDSKIYIYIYIINPIGSTSSAVLFVSYKNCHRGFINLRQKALAQSRATRNGKPAVCAQLWGSQGQLRPQAMLPWPHCFLEVPLQSPHTCWAVHGGNECQTPSAIMQYAKPSWANAAQRHGGHHSPTDFQATGPF